MIKSDAEVQQIRAERAATTSSTNGNATTNGRKLKWLRMQHH